MLTLSGAAHIAINLIRWCCVRLTGGTKKGTGLRFSESCSFFISNAAIG